MSFIDTSNKYSMKKHYQKVIKLYRTYGPKDTGWYFATVALLATYLLIFQAKFVFSGDIWAETFSEYVNEAVTLGWGEVIKSSWAGYLTIIPSFFSELYVALGLPLGYIDFYLRAVSLAFVVLCVSFIAHPINRRLIPHDGLRVLIAFIMLLSLRHVSTLSFINVWYAGFIVIALVSLSNVKLSKLWEVAYTLFAIAVVFSKSSLVLLPFILYRAITTKRYMQSGLIATAIVWQTYLTVFSKNGYGNDELTVGLADIVRDLFLGAPVLTLKILHLSPSSPFVVLLMAIIMVALLVYAWKRLQKWQLLVVGSSLAISMYLHIFAPDNNFKNLWQNFSALYDDTYKLQREFFITFLLLLALAILASAAYKALHRPDKKLRMALYALPVLILVGINPFSQIDNSSPGVSMSAGPYRASLNAGVSTCMPVPPTPSWNYESIWFFQYKGGCYLKQPAKEINYASFNNRLTTKGTPVTITTTPKDDLKSVLLLVKKQVGTRPTLTLIEKGSGHTYTSQARSSNSEYAFISFNVNNLGPRPETYSFTLRPASGQQDGVFVGNFKDSKQPVLYGYFMGYPNLQ